MLTAFSAHIMNMLTACPKNGAVITNMLTKCDWHVEDLLQNRKTEFNWWWDFEVTCDSMLIACYKHVRCWRNAPKMEQWHSWVMRTLEWHVDSMLMSCYQHANDVSLTSWRSAPKAENWFLQVMRFWGDILTACWLHTMNMLTSSYWHVQDLLQNW